MSNRAFLQLVTAVTLALDLIACGGGGAAPADQPPLQWGTGSHEFSGGLALQGCEGGAEQVACFYQDGNWIGTAEHLKLAVPTLDFLDGVDDPVESVQLVEADYLTTFEADRTSTCPQLTFQRIPERAVTVAGSPGIAFGFSQTEGDRVVEKNLLYAVRVEFLVRIFNFPSLDSGSCVGNEGALSPSQLDAISADLDGVMAEVVFPAG
ncbi:MAG: hypothetical protein ACT4OP_07505 [Actinomycetota bacterium]